MIAGTPWSPAQAFIDAAQNLLTGVAEDDFGQAFRHLDANEDGSRWSKSQFLAQVRDRSSGRITSPLGHSKSARPVVDALVEGDVYELRHAIPIDGRWSDLVIVLRFARKEHSQYFHMRLVDVEAR